MGNIFGKKINNSSEKRESITSRSKGSNNDENLSDSTKTPVFLPEQDSITPDLELFSLENKENHKISKEKYELVQTNHTSEEEFLKSLERNLSEHDINILRSLPTVFEELKNLYVSKKEVPILPDSLSKEVVINLDHDSTMLFLDLDCIKVDYVGDPIDYVWDPIINIFLATSYKKDSEVEKKILTEVKLPEWVLQERIRSFLMYPEDLGKLEDMFKSINKPTDLESCLYEASRFNNLEAFKFVLGHLEAGSNFIANNHQKIFDCASAMMYDEEFCYFHPEFLTFIARELRESLGIKTALKECIRGSIDFGGYHCSKYDFFSAVLLAFPEIKTSTEEVLTKLRNEEHFYLADDEEGELGILDETNTEKCIGEILREEGVEDF